MCDDVITTSFLSCTSLLVTRIVVNLDKSLVGVNPFDILCDIHVLK